MSARVASLITQKGDKILTVTSGDTIGAAVAVLVANRIGAVPVVGEAGVLAGIVSERDIVRALGSADAGSLLAEPVDRIMTRAVRTCSPEDAVVELMDVMTRHRIRHLPVLQDGKLVAMVSIGDVVKQRLEEAHDEIEALKTYLYAS